MTEQITLEEALYLVTFFQKLDGTWAVANVKGDCGTVKGYCGTVEGDCNFVEGDCITVKGNCGTVEGKVLNTINGRQWAYVETPEEKLRRLIKETGNQELIEAFNQLENT